MRDRRTIALGLYQRLRHRLDRFQAGAAGEVLVGLLALLQIGELRIGQDELFSQGHGLRADFVGNPAKGRFHRHARFDADEHQVERIRPRHLDRLLALGGTVIDVEHRCVEAAIGNKDADEHLDQERLVRQSAEHEQIHQRQREADERKNKAEEQEARQRILTAKAGNLELLQRAFVGQRAPQIKAIDNVAHADRLFLAQTLAPAVGFGGKPGALLGAQLIALQSHGFHTVLELVAAKGRQQREDGGEYSDGDQQGDQECRVR